MRMIAADGKLRSAEPNLELFEKVEQWCTCKEEYHITSQEAESECFKQSTKCMKITFVGNLSLLPADS